MKYSKWIVVIALGVLVITGACRKEPAPDERRPSATELDIAIGGLRVVSLSQPQTADKAQPQFLNAEILPGRGMNIYQLRAYLPDRGVVDLISAPPLEKAKEQMNGGPDDFQGNMSFKIGGAILVPFANRIRGKLLPDGKTLETIMLGKPVTLPANWKGKNPNAEPHAMHGLILASAMNSVETHAGAKQAATVIGTLQAGDFQGHWLSKTDLTISAALKSDLFIFIVTATNLGSEDLPMGIGWHPYFVFPSGQREQVKLHIPARERALVNNYDDVFPTGQLVPMAGTAYDFSVAGGAPLQRLFLDDCFVNLQKDRSGYAVAEVIDPAARYGLRVKALSPEISAFQVYAPVAKAFVALEPQFNWADPFSALWQGKNTGMVILKPGQSVSYAVQLELFVP
jgi:galactose mutarotase-like enzyme